MAQSVVMPQSMVPMLGWIMPEPLAMAPMVTVLPPSSTVTAISFTFSVGGEDGVGGVQGGLGGVRQSGDQGGNPLLNGLDVQLHTDDAGGGRRRSPGAAGRWLAAAGLGTSAGRSPCPWGRRRWRCRCQK